MTADQGFYSRHVLPHLVHLACSLKPIGRQREKVVPLARGRVLEIGVGSGLNLAYYDPGKVSRVFGLDPSAEMIAKAKRAARSSSLEIEFLNAPAESFRCRAGASIRLWSPTACAPFRNQTPP